MPTHIIRSPHTELSILYRLDLEGKPQIDEVWLHIPVKGSVEFWPVAELSQLLDVFPYWKVGLLATLEELPQTEDDTVSEEPT